MQTLFHLKDKKLYPTCKIYYGVCECEENITSAKQKETTTRWSEHDNPNKDSEPARYLNKLINHVFSCKILCHTSKKFDICKNQELIFIALVKPSLNEQKNFECLILFRNGIM